MHWPNVQSNFDPFYNLLVRFYYVSIRQTIDRIWFVIGAFGLGFIFLLYGISQSLIVLSGIGVALLLGGGYSTTLNFWIETV